MNRIERRLIGEPITVDERALEPVAQVAGWHASGGNDAGGGAGTWLRVSPVEVIVQEEDGTRHHVPVINRTREAVRGMILAALAVAGMCWLLMYTLRKEATE